jgi:hypothetical protein
MSVNLTRFVNINVKRVSERTLSSTRDTVALFTSETGSIANIYSSYDEVIASMSNATKTCSYAKQYFDNGGTKLKIVTDELSIMTIDNLDDNIICIAKVDGLSDTDIEDICSAYTESAAGIKRKLFFTNIIADSFDSIVTKANVAYKKGAAGIEMTMMAYLSQINADEEGSARDYCFTIETVNATDIYDDDTVVGKCMAANVNVDTTLSGETRNIGGNLSTGIDLVNEYMIIILQQMVTDAVTSVLCDKVKGASGCAAVYAAVVSELNRFVKNGSIAAGNWISEDWIATYNEEKYTVISANERLSTGYKVVVVPFSSQTATDAKQHLATPIYVALTNAYGIRKVTIAGEVA